jgi:hypothetical protein
MAAIWLARVRFSRMSRKNQPLRPRRRSRGHNRGGGRGRSGAVPVQPSGLRIIAT